MFDPTRLATASVVSVFAGATVVAWYPITPSSSLAEALEHYIPRLRKAKDGKATYAVIQAEDERAERIRVRPRRVRFGRLPRLMAPVWVTFSPIVVEADLGPKGPRTVDRSPSDEGKTMLIPA